MRKITLFLLLFSVASLIMTTGCGSDDTTTTPTDNNQDSTPTVTIDNQILIGLELFRLNEETDRTFGEYDTRDTSTYISVFGNDQNFGDASFNITFPGKTTGTFVTEVGSSDVDLHGVFKQHQSLHIPVGQWHQLANEHDVDLKLVEIQYGSNCVEEDIERKDT